MSSPRALLDDLEHHYSPDEARPLGSFSGMLGGYGLVLSALLGSRLGRRSQALRWPEIFAYGLTVGTISRVIAKDPITSPLRAPFTRFTGDTTGPAELDEEVVGTGARKAIGELITCPFCVAPWTATALIALHRVAPARARTVVDIFAVTTISDLLQYTIAAAQKAE